jgi:hypothetical protein
VVLLLPIAVDALIELSSQQFWKNLRWIANTTSALAALVGWLSTQVKAGNSWIRNVEEAYEKVAAARQTRIVDSEKQERAELQLAREREAAAKKRLEEATLQLQRIEQEIEAQKPGPRLRRFIEERGGTSDYTKHLSIITLIRKDFEALSDLIRTGDPALPIDRIVLYIDDLDRCRPGRVIEVLEAVHLLLAFRLFVVVVAVDPRWLTRCLELHYPELLGGRGVDEMDASSPQDYLEKIFQIPFMVRPIDVRGYRDLIRSLVPISVVQASLPKAVALTEPADRIEAPSVTSAHVTPTESVPLDSSSPSGSSPPYVSTPAENIAQRETPAPGIHDEESFKIDPSQLEITASERLGIEALAPLFTTPRSVKRFVNIYRLMRVSLGPDELGVFEGTDDAPGDHRTALLLLALVTNYPRLATHVLARLNTTSDIRTWPQFLSHVTSPEAPVPQGLVNDDAADWKRMCGRLRLLESEHLPDVLASSVTWTPRVVRYSFFVAPRIA